MTRLWLLLAGLAWTLPCLAQPLAAPAVQVPAAIAVQVPAAATPSDASQAATAASSVARAGADAAVLTPADLNVDAQVQIRADEGKVIVTLEMRLHVDRPGTLHLRAWHVPLLAPIVRDSVLDRGSVPGGAKSLESQHEGDIAITRAGGGLAVTGKLTAAKPAMVRVRYPVPTPSAALVLGFAPNAGRGWLTLAVIAVAPARLRLALDRPARTSRFEQGGERLVGASLAQVLRPGDVVRVALGDLPVTPAWPRRALVTAAVLLALWALAALWTRRVLDDDEAALAHLPATPASPESRP